MGVTKFATAERSPVVCSGNLEEMKKSTKHSNAMPMKMYFELILNLYFILYYKCDKNEEHKGTNLYFKTFERFYLKEINIDKCEKCCSLLENYIKYECKLCEKYFCSTCFIFHKHFKQNINNILIKSKKCKIHIANNIHFCKYCKIYLCNYCIKDKNNMHKEHNIENLYDLMPSKNKIEKLKKRIKEYDDLIQNIDSWIKEFNQKIIRLKQNIIDEKELLQKLILNFNQSFNDYSYFSNFNHLYKYSKNFNNEYLDEFSKTSSFEEKGKILFNYINQLYGNLKTEIPNQKVKINSNKYLEKKKHIDDCIISQITDNYFFLYSYQDKEIRILKYKNKKDEFVKLKGLKEKFLDGISNAWIIDNQDKTYTIYGNVSNSKKVVIWNFDLNLSTLTRSNDEIVKEGFGIFQKVIKLSDELIATDDTHETIDIWTKDKESINGYSHLCDIISENNITDILSVNSDYFISSHYEKEIINFYDIKSLSLEKTIYNIKCSNESNSLLLFNNQYILINCEKGLAVISIKTKEVVQYIEDYFDNYYNRKEFVLNSNNNIYIMYVNEMNLSDYSSEDSGNIGYINISVLKYCDFSFHVSEVYEDLSVHDNLHLIFVIDEKIMLCGNNLYLLN